MVSLLSDKRFISAFLSFVMSLLAASSSAGQDLRFGVSGDFAPYEFRDQNNQLTGFDIQVAQSICAHLNKHCVFVDVAWDDLIPGLSGGKYDAIISAFSPSPERLKQVAFTDRYMAEEGKDIAMAVLKGATKLKKDLNAGIKAIKANGDLQAAFDKYFPGKANPLAAELTGLAGAEKQTNSAANPTGGDKSPEIANTTDGFEFRTLLNENKTPMWEAFGGPCRPAGIYGMAGRVDDALAATKPDYRNNYAINAYSYLDGTNLKVAWAVRWNVDWQSTAAEYEEKYQSAVQHRLSSQEISRAHASSQIAECLAMNYIQYVIALENWAKKNRKQLQAMWDVFLKSSLRN